jgi:hypothetical protein
MNNTTATNFENIINQDQRAKFSNELRFINDLLKAHDKYYEMSDDRSIYRRGEIQKDNIIKLLVEKVGLSARQAYQYYNQFLFQ